MSHSKTVQTRRRKQKGKRQLANLAKQAKKLKEGDRKFKPPFCIDPTVSATLHPVKLKARTPIAAQR